MSDNEKDLPKRVTLRVPLRDYKKIIQVSLVAEQLKSSKEGKKAIRDLIRSDENLNISVDSFLNMLIRLPTTEVNISKPPAKREPPKTMYFTDSKPTTAAVKSLYKVVKDEEFKNPLRHDQVKSTCPTDVRTMFYVYIHKNSLVNEEKKEITLDKFIKKLAPKATKNLDTILRKDSSTIWKICSEIRGEEITKKKK